MSDPIHPENTASQEALQDAFPTKGYPGLPQDQKTQQERSQTAQSARPKELVNHPNHYGGKNNPYEAIKIIEAYGWMGPHRTTALKYVLRAGEKLTEPNETHTDAEIRDLQKAVWYLQRRIAQLHQNAPPAQRPTGYDQAAHVVLSSRGG